MTTRVCGFAKLKNLQEYSIGGNKETVVGVFFEEKSFDLCTVSIYCTVCQFSCHLYFLLVLSVIEINNLFHFICCMEIEYCRVYSVIITPLSV